MPKKRASLTHLSLKTRKAHVRGARSPSVACSSGRYSSFLLFCHASSRVPGVTRLLCDGVVYRKWRDSVSWIGVTRAAGVPVHCNRVEARHQSLKSAMVSSCQRPGDILRHLARRRHVALALQDLLHGLTYEALTSRPPHGWQMVQLTATQDCRGALDIMATMLPLTSLEESDRARKPRRATYWEGRVRVSQDSASTACSAGSTDA